VLLVVKLKGREARRDRRELPFGCTSGCRRIFAGSDFGGAGNGEFFIGNFKYSYLSLYIFLKVVRRSPLSLRE
jgi:hypothetical protein